MCLDSKQQLWLIEREEKDHNFFEIDHISKNNSIQMVYNTTSSQPLMQASNCEAENPQPKKKQIKAMQYNWNLPNKSEQLKSKASNEVSIRGVSGSILAERAADGAVLESEKGVITGGAAAPLLLLIGIGSRRLRVARNQGLPLILLVLLWHHQVEFRSDQHCGGGGQGRRRLLHRRIRRRAVGN